MLKRLFHFIGSVYFAIALIGTTSLIVAGGTIVESLRDSHQVAMRHAYGNPVFLSLLALFFVNIFVAALRRYPFKWKHIPFLITHLGLLMIIAGVMVKNHYGTQGQLGVIEGGESNRLLISDTYAVELLKKGEGRAYQVHYQNGNLTNPGDLNIEVLAFSPHCREKSETWIKNSFAVINGLKPFLVKQWPEDPLIPGAKVAIPNSSFDFWEFYAFQSSDISSLALQIFIEQTQIVFRDHPSDKIIYEARLDQCLDHTIVRNNHTFFAHLDFDYSTETGFVFPSLNLMIDHEKLTIPLTGSEALLNLTESGSLPIVVDLQRNPSIAFLQDDEDDVYFFAFDPHGQLFADSFQADALRSYISYDQGHGGYAVAASLPFTPHTFGRKERENAQLTLLEEQLDKAKEEQLAPPLEAFRHACMQAQQPFIPSLMQFLSFWDNSCDSILSDTSLPQLLKDIVDFMPLDSDKASHFCAWMRTYGLTLSALKPKEITLPEQEMILECPLTVRYEPAVPLQKLEDNRPLIRLKVNNEIVTLGYDKYGQGLHRPILGGEYLVRFQPQIQEIPHHVRLRNARQLNFPGTEQPYSYESDLIIAGIPTTISMNEVFETWDGYRFYLAGISPGKEITAQRIQLVVNRDPAKYFLTYPGGMILALGIILLFGLRPYR